jgi:hypothetical protein
MTMEGCLYRQFSTDNYYMVSGVASYFVLVKDFINFGERFLQKEDILTDYYLIEFNQENIMILLDNYKKFYNNINYTNLKDFSIIIYNDRKYFIKTWNDVYNFIEKNH